MNTNNYKETNNLNILWIFGSMLKLVCLSNVQKSRFSPYEIWLPIDFWQKLSTVKMTDSYNMQFWLIFTFHNIPLELVTPQYSWNTAKVGVKHQSINWTGHKVLTFYFILLWIPLILYSENKVFYYSSF